MTSVSAVTQDECRRVLRHLPTSVAVVSTQTEEGPQGMTVGSVTSVSLAPPMILFCPSRASETWARIQTHEYFCINVLGSGDEAVARRFASQTGDRFAGIAWHERESGIGLDSAAAWIECSMTSEHAAGDHTIVVADIIRLEAAGHLHPLIFWGGGFNSLALNDADGASAAGVC